MAELLQTRIECEQYEKERLAAYAMASGESRLRRFDEPEHLYRTCFQRDRDRIIHSAAFRRLEAKTQVFLDPSSDYYRTRLTHTIEVAQIARTIARILYLNEDLAEAAALAHDLGHPPYGHCGETVLNELMAEHGGFEHNRQSLRIVEYLEHPYPAFRGLNLTYETRECLAKHETRYDSSDVPDEYGSGQAPLEGQIADLADAIAYNSHDLDDALACDLISEKDLAAVAIYKTVKSRITEQFPQAHRFARQLRCAKAVIDLLVADALEETARRLREAAPSSAEDVRRTPRKLVALSPAAHSQLTELEKFLGKRVYGHHLVTRAQEQAQRELRYLFGAFVATPSLLPQRYQQRLEEQGIHRVVCDYLAGMTDRYCHWCFEHPTTS